LFGRDPPARSTWPEPSSVAVCVKRGVVVEPVAAKLPPK